MRVKAAKVDAIKDRADIDRLREHFKANYEAGEMYALLITIGCNTGLRAGDLRKLTIGQFRHGDYLEILEDKTGKPRTIYINQAIRKALAPYDLGITEGILYFDAHSLFGGAKQLPIQVKHIHKLIKQGCRDIGLQGNYGSHTLRKTFAWHSYGLCRSKDVMQELFSHSSMAVTMAYLTGVEPERETVMQVQGIAPGLVSATDYIYASLNL